MVYAVQSGFISNIFKYFKNLYILKIEKCFHKGFERYVLNNITKSTYSECMVFNRKVLNLYTPCVIIITPQSYKNHTITIYYNSHMAL